VFLILVGHNDREMMVPRIDQRSLRLRVALIWRTVTTVADNESQEPDFDNRSGTGREKGAQK